MRGREWGRLGPARRGRPAGAIWERPSNRPICRAALLGQMVGKGRLPQEPPPPAPWWSAAAGVAGVWLLGSPPHAPPTPVPSAAGAAAAGVERRTTLSCSSTSNRPPCAGQGRPPVPVPRRTAPCGRREAPPPRLRPCAVVDARPAVHRRHTPEDSASETILSGSRLLEVRPCSPLSKMPEPRVPRFRRRAERPCVRPWC